MASNVAKSASKFMTKVANLDKACHKQVENVRQRYSAKRVVLFRAHPNEVRLLVAGGELPASSLPAVEFAPEAAE